MYMYSTNEDNMNIFDACRFAPKPSSNTEPVLPGPRPSEDDDRDDSNPATLDADLAAQTADAAAQLAALPFDLRCHAERLRAALDSHPGYDGFKDALAVVFLAAQWRTRTETLFLDLNPKAATQRLAGLRLRRDCPRTDASRLEIEQRHSRYLYRWASRSAKHLLVDHEGQPLNSTLLALIRPTSPGLRQRPLRAHGGGLRRPSYTA